MRKITFTDMHVKYWPVILTNRFGHVSGSEEKMVLQLAGSERIPCIFFIFYAQNLA